MAIAFYFDDNCSDSKVIAILRREGVTVVTSLEAGMYGAPDVEHLRFAVGRGLTLITGDEADFPRLSAELLRAGGTHHGIVIVKQRRFSPGEQARRLVLLAQDLRDGMADQVDYLSRWSSAPR